MPTATAILTLIHIKDPSCASIYRCYCWLFPFRARASRPRCRQLQAGFFHPLTGLDHLLMLTGAGVLSALSGRKLLLPFATLGMMLVGAIAGSLLGGFSGMEMLIIASLAVSGVMMFKTENRLLLAVPALAMFHGWAHGVEMSGHSFWLFTSGFMFASATVLCASFAAGLAAAPSRRPA
jgi:urease accessory protein